jgi:hypothetical protein
MPQDDKGDRSYEPGPDRPFALAASDLQKSGNRDQSGIGLQGRFD